MSVLTIDQIEKVTAEELRIKVQPVIDELRTYIQSDGGDLELIDVTAQGQVFVRLTGACDGCGSATVTLKAGIEERIKQVVPEITEVLAA